MRLEQRQPLVVCQHNDRRLRRFPGAGTQTQTWQECSGTGTGREGPSTQHRETQHRRPRDELRFSRTHSVPIAQVRQGSSLSLRSVRLLPQAVTRHLDGENKG
jgi:hypothetical protein